MSASRLVTGMDAACVCAPLLTADSPSRSAEGRGGGALTFEPSVERPRVVSPSALATRSARSDAGKMMPCTRGRDQNR